MSSNGPTCSTGSAAPLRRVGSEQTMVASAWAATQYSGLPVHRPRAGQLAMTQFHDLSMDAINGEAIDFARYKGISCLVVNVASR